MTNGRNETQTRREVAAFRYCQQSFQLSPEHTPVLADDKVTFESGMEEDRGGERGGGEKGVGA